MLELLTAALDIALAFSSICAAYEYFPVLVAIFYGEKIGKISFVGAIIVLASALFYNLRGTGVEENVEKAK